MISKYIILTFLSFYFLFGVKDGYSLNFTLSNKSKTLVCDFVIESGEGYRQLEILMKRLKMLEIFENLKGVLTLKEGKIYIPYIYNNTFKLSGKILEDFSSGEINLRFLDISTKELKNILGVDIEGILKFKTRLSGDIHFLIKDKDLFIKAEIRCCAGEIGDVPFVLGKLNLRGYFPYLYFRDSYFIKPNNNKIYIRGGVDVSNLEESIYFAKFSQESLEFADLMLSSPDKSKVSIKENKGKYKVFLYSSEDKREQKFDFLYNIKNKNYIKLRFQEDKALFGIEKRWQF